MRWLHYNRFDEKHEAVMVSPPSSCLVGAEKENRPAEYITTSGLGIMRFSIAWFHQYGPPLRARW